MFLFTLFSIYCYKYQLGLSKTPNLSKKFSNVSFLEYLRFERTIVLIILSLGIKMHFGGLTLLPSLTAESNSVIILLGYT